MTVLDAELRGDLDVAGFVPSAGIVNVGTERHLVLVASECTVGPIVLGSVLVNAPGEGSLCLAPWGESSLQVVNCPAVDTEFFAWPEDLKVTGVRTDGGSPCVVGRGCDEIGTPVSAPPIAWSESSTLVARPNPFTGSIELVFSLSSAEQIRASIHDVRGRLIRRLADTAYPAGDHGLLWDGRDSAGRLVPAGVYFARLEANGTTQTRKIVRLSPQ
jgi:hypothetical protein